MRRCRPRPRPPRRAIARAASGPVAPGQVRQVLPPPVHEPAVAPARSAAADVLLEQHDARAGHPLAEEVGGPHPRVAAADDRDLGVDLTASGGAGAGSRSAARASRSHQLRWRPGSAGRAVGRPGVASRSRSAGFTTIRTMIAMTRTARTSRPSGLAPSWTNSSDCAPLPRRRRSALSVGE